MTFLSLLLSRYNEGPLGAKKDIALLFPKFFQKRPDWKIAVVSGTADAAVPFLGTERWMECLKRDVKDDWYVMLPMRGEATLTCVLYVPGMCSHEHDFVLITGTAVSLSPLLTPYRRAWKMDGDVAGMVKDWDHISLITVKGCGHTIPTYCPEAGYAFFANWLSGDWS